MKEFLLHLGVFSVLIGLFYWVARDGRWPWEDPTGERDPDVVWCVEHDLPEAECTICNPGVGRGGTRVLQSGTAEAGQCPNTLKRIELGEGVAEAIGLELAEVQARPVDERLRATAQTRYAPDTHAHLAPRLAGVLREVRVRIGQRVEPGDVLAVVEAPELGRAKSQLLGARQRLSFWQRTYDNRKELHPQLVTLSQMLEAESGLQEARLELAQAEQALAVLGLSAEEVARVAESGDVEPALALVAPRAGQVVALDAVAGELAGPERPVVELADLERLWLVIDVFESDLSRVAPDQEVTFLLEALPGERFAGRVVAIGGEVDARTRTVPVHAELENPGLLLRAGMFGEAEIRIRSEEPRIVLPRAAVQNDGDCLLAFVAEDEDVFVARKLEVAAVHEAGYQVRGGLEPGERVVTTGSFLLKTEILRGQIGAG